MSQSKKIKINGVEGRGFLEVTSPPSPQTRKQSRGVAVFDAREKIEAMKKAHKEGRARYEGVVYRDGKPKTESISVIIKHVDSGEGRVVFELG